jgi:membrane-bound metal-dependent hydrolase YbcI (DUF457 family)
MPLPIAHGLIGASIVAALLPDASPVRNWKPLVLGAALASAPDVDYFFRTDWHRSFTHSIVFAVAISLICLSVWGAAKIRLAIGCAGAACSHTLLDYAMTKSMPGVELFWPLSRRRFGLGLVDYYELTGVDPVFFLTQDVLADLLKLTLMELLIFVPLFLLVLSIKWSVSNSSS